MGICVFAFGMGLVVVPRGAKRGERQEPQTRAPGVTTVGGYIPPNVFVNSMFVG